MKKKYNEKYWQDRCDEIMDNFDFDKVHECMTKLNWKWVNNKSNTVRIPDKSEIREEARRLLKECIDRNHIKNSSCWMVSCGGFKAQIDLNEGWLILEFIVADWESFI